MTEATIAAPEGTQTISITREFDAPPDAVYRAHIDPALFAQWNGPDATATRVRSWDARTGGHWSYLSEFGEQSVGFYGSFHELREAERIVQTFTFEGYPDAVMLEIMSIVGLGGGRCRVESLSIFDSVENRDGMVASGMEVGVREGYAKLDRLLAR